MPPNNPYIKKVLKDPDIFTDTERIYAQKGRWSEYFGNTNPLVLEIGTGMGNFFGKIVGENPEKNFIGMEIRYKRLFQTAEKARRSSFFTQNSPHTKRPHLTSPNGRGTKEKTFWNRLQPHFSLWEKIVGGLTTEKIAIQSNNFTLLKDFGEHIDQIFSPGEISETYIFFPDPWARKDRQRKHRLMQEDFLEKLFTITAQGGKVFFKSDHREYFDSTVEIIKKHGKWNIATLVHDYENSEYFDMENITSFEAMYRGEKKEINYLELSR